MMTGLIIVNAKNRSRTCLRNASSKDILALNQFLETDEYDFECQYFNQRTCEECDGHHQAVSSVFYWFYVIIVTKIWGFGCFFGLMVLVFLCLTK